MRLPRSGAAWYSNIRSVTVGGMADVRFAAALAQPSLFALGPPAVRADATFERIELGPGAWVDVARDWFGGADELCQRLESQVLWRQRRRRMYDRMVDEPRLVRWYRAGDPLPDEALGACRAQLGRRYGVRFGAVGLNFYRHGHDSVAWHADRELRHLSDTLVAIVTLGAARPFLLRAKDPGGRRRSLDLHPASGDLLVMGGACQESWEHAVPKVAAAGPRISVSMRWVRRPHASTSAPTRRLRPPSRAGVESR
jgi:alkylated DNA repair dioxygenase AlkB